MTPLNLKLCNYSDFRQLLVIGRGMFWGDLGCALEEIGTSQDLQMQESESGAQTRPVYDAGVHSEWDIQWILNPQLVLISALMHKRNIWSSNGHDDGCPGRPSNEVQPFPLLSSEQLYHAFSWLANSHPLHWKENFFLITILTFLSMSEGYVIVYESGLHSMCILTWHLQEILDKMNVSLRLWRQLIKTADSLSATTPARERLISHFNLCEDVHVCWKIQWQSFIIRKGLL